jgi:hypothetical protein
VIKMRCFISIDFPVEDNTGKLLGELGTISGIKSKFFTLNPKISWRDRF